MTSKARRIIAVLCALCMLIGLMPMGISAAESANGTFTDKNNIEFTWAYDASSKTLTIGGSGAMNWTGNNHVNGLPWSSFKGEILDVKFESGVTRVGRQLLSGLTSVKTLTIPSTITELEWGAMEGCTSLESVVFESGVKHIGDKIFQNCTSLTSVSFPETVVKLGNAVFLNTPITEVTVPASVINLFPADTFQTQYTFDGVADGFVAKIYNGSYAAYWVQNPDLNISSKLNYEIIGEELPVVSGKMANGAGVEDAITWTYNPNNHFLTIEGSGATPKFASSAEHPWIDYKANIYYAVIGEGINVLGERTFETYNAMKGVSLPSTLREIRAYAFNNASGLTKVVLPAGLTHLNTTGIFNRAIGLKELVIPASVTTINANALRFTPTDLKLIVCGGTPAHTWAMSEANNCINTDDSSSARAYVVVNDGGKGGDKITWEYDWENKILTFTGEGTMTEANEHAWHVYKAVAEKVVIGYGITNVAKVGFKNFTALTSVELPSTIKEFRDNCFNGCTALTELDVPHGTKTFGLTIISGSAIKKLVVPPSVTTIYPNDVNKLHKHKSLTGTVEGFELIVSENSYAHTWATGTTTDKDSGETINNYEGILTVKNPGGKANDTIDWEYDVKTATMTFTGTGDMPNWTTLDVDGDGSATDEPTWYENRPWHAYVASTRKLVFGEGITVIGADTFRGGSSLKEVVFPSTLKRIKQYAFANTGLVEVTLNNGLEYLEAGVFQQSNPAEVLQKVVIPNSVISMVDTAFKNQSALTIYCYGGSYTQGWAEKNAVKHVLLDSDYYVTYTNYDAKAVITNYTEESLDAVVVMANTTNGILNSIYTEEITLNPGKNESVADKTFVQENGSITKVMVLESLTTMKPVVKSIETKITPVIRVAGDSISAPWPATRYGQQGWGEPFKNEWNDTVTVYNDAVSGWTTEKYYTEKWPGIKAELKPGDYLIVSYLHNDYYVPVKDPSKANYIDTYRDYLVRLITETREMGVNIVLVVPPNRGVPENFHGDFSFVMPALAEEYNVPCIDVHAKTIEMLNEDLEGTKQLLYMYKLVEQGIVTPEQLANHSNATYRANGEDLTHISTKGAEWIANYVAEEMVKLIPELANSKN